MTSWWHQQNVTLFTPLLGLDFSQAQWRHFGTTKAFVDGLSLDHTATSKEEDAIIYLTEDEEITNLNNWTQKNYFNSLGTLIK